MKKVLGVLITLLALSILPSTTLAGDCQTRDTIEGQATITSAVYVRNTCPTGDIVGTVPAGEVVNLLEVDRYGEFYLIETSVGTGFVFNSFLKDISYNQKTEIQFYENSIYPDLDPNHKYYNEIATSTQRGIISGTAEGYILADENVTRSQIAKILVESVTSNEDIEAATLQESTAILKPVLGT